MDTLLQKLRSWVDESPSSREATVTIGAIVWVKFKIKMKTRWLTDEIAFVVDQCDASIDSLIAAKIDDIIAGLDQLVELHLDA